MNLDEVIESLPSYAKDLKLNFSSVVRQQTDLTEQQLWGTVVASAVASRNEQLIAAAVDEAATHLTPEALDGESCGRHHGHEQCLLPLQAPHLQ
jgi:lipoyl-dependent peroxiredoxin subunit D